MVELGQTWYGLLMRWFAYFCIVIALGACKEELYFIPGTGTLPECDEAPSANLDGTTWFDQGTVTILTSGCLGAEPDATFKSRQLNMCYLVRPGEEWKAES